MRVWTSLAAATAALLFTVALGAAIAFPGLTGRVVDQANILPAAVRAELEQLLAAHEAATSNQVVVVTVESLQGHAIEDYGYQLGRYWGIGQEGRDNGVLLIVAPAERKVRIEVGYGLEGTLTDALANHIIRTVILPKFRAGDMAAGTMEGTRAILQVIEGTYQPPTGRRGGAEGRYDNFMGWFIFLVIAGEALARLVRARPVSAALLGGGALLIGWLVLGSLLAGAVMAVLIGVFHLMIGGAGGWGGGLPGLGSGGAYRGGHRRSGMGRSGGFRGGGGGFGGGGASGGW